MHHDLVVEDAARRVRLTPASPRDAARTFETLDAAATRNLAFFSTPPTLERQRAWLERMERSETDKLFVVERAEDGAVVGAVGLHEFDAGNRNARVGVLIFDPSERGKGYWKEIMALLHRHAFRDLGLHKLYVRVLARNEEGKRKYLRLGYRIEGVLREEYFLDGAFLDMVGLSLLSRAWREAS